MDAVPHAQPLLAAASVVLVLAGAELFTTGTEWVGHRFDLSESTTGSVFAALATTVPETLIPLIAIIEGSGETIGVGAILGGPLSLATLALGLLGITRWVEAVRGGPQPSLSVDRREVRHDLRVFLAGFSLALLVALVPWRFLALAATPVLAGLYGWYLLRILTRNQQESPPEPEPLELGKPLNCIPGVGSSGADGRSPTTAPPTVLIVLQVGFALTLLVVGSHLLVGAIEWAAGTVIGLPSILLALLVAPVVSNLPENVDGIIWVRRGKDRLAVEQVTGTLAYQGTVGVAIGTLFTAWHLEPVWGSTDFLVGVAGVLALLAGGALAVGIRRADGRIPVRLPSALGAGYLVFVVLVGGYVFAGYFG